MTRRVDNDQSNSKPKARIRPSRNVRIRNRDKKELSAKEEKTKVEQPANKKSDIAVEPQKQSTLQNSTHQSEIADTNNTQISSDISNLDASQKEQGNDKQEISDKEVSSKKEDAPEAPKERAIKKKRESHRQRRKERQANRKRELLDSAIKKIQAESGDVDALKNLKENIDEITNPNSQSSGVATSLAKDDILKNGEISTPKQTNKPSAKDRFKNALKPITQQTEKEEEVFTGKSHKDSLKAEEFRRKIAERERIKKIAHDYLKKMGLSYSNNDFRSLSNAIADNLLFNIEQTLPRYQKTVDKLKERKQLPIRKGREADKEKNKQENAQSVIGSLFADYPINSDDNQDFIFINPKNTNNEFKIPTNDIDQIRDDLLKSLLYDTNRKNTHIDNRKSQENKSLGYDEKNAIQDTLDKQQKIDRKQQLHDKLASSQKNYINVNNTNNQQKTPIDNKPALMSKTLISKHSLKNLLSEKMRKNNNDTNLLKSELKKTTDKIKNQNNKLQ